MYDFGWRHYMPDIGRWNAMDQLAEKYMPISPYAYVANNPISLIDPDGRKITKNDDGTFNITGADYIAYINYLNNGGDPITLGKHLNTYLSNNGGFGSGPLSEFWSYFNEYNSVYRLRTQYKQTFTFTFYVQTSTHYVYSFDNVEEYERADVLRKRDKEIDHLFNTFLGVATSISLTTEAWLEKEKRSLMRTGTKTATKKINKYVKPSIEKVNKFSKRLGHIGAAYNSVTLGYDIIAGEEITAGDVVDTAIAVGLSFVAISNPIGLLVLGAYTIIDMHGGFDGIKESLGMNTVIINKK